MPAASATRPLDKAFALSRPTVLGVGGADADRQQDQRPAEIAEDVLINAIDVESLCSLSPGTLQNKVLAFPTLRSV